MTGWSSGAPSGVATDVGGVVGGGDGGQQRVDAVGLGAGLSYVSDRGPLTAWRWGKRRHGGARGAWALVAITLSWLSSTWSMSPWLPAEPSGHRAQHRLHTESGSRGRRLYLPGNGDHENVTPISNNPLFDHRNEDFLVTQNRI